jgi:hypothetical protein
VVDKNMNVVELQRDEDDNFKLAGLVMPNGQVHSLKVNKHGELEMWRTPSNFVTAFQYQDGGGLLTKMFVGGKMQNVFEYNAETGHLSAVRAPVGAARAASFLGESGQAAGVRKHGLLTHAQLARENVLIQQLYESEYLLSPLLAVRDTLLGNLTVHRLGWTYFQHEFRHAATFCMTELGPLFFWCPRLRFRAPGRKPSRALILRIPYFSRPHFRSP